MGAYGPLRLRRKSAIRNHYHRKFAASLATEAAASAEALAQELDAGDSTLEDDQFEEAVRRVYEMLRMDPESQAVAKEWELRHSTETSPETQERLKAALHAQCVRGGTRLTCPL